MGLLQYEEVQQHNKKDDLWVIVQGNAYDLTEVRALTPPRSSGQRLICHRVHTVRP